MGACLNSSATIPIDDKPKEDRRVYSVPSSDILQLPSSVSIDDFIIERVIGKGSYGKVYLVTKADTHQLYAMKSIKLGAYDLETCAGSLEANRLELMGCPFLIPAQYVLLSSGKVYVVSDYVSGGQLFTYVRKQGRLPEDSARIYLAELAVAVEFLHARRFVYSDLKPDNLLLDRDGHLMLTAYRLNTANLAPCRLYPQSCRHEYDVPDSLRGYQGGDIWSFVRLS
jgi:serine/threonine protein kinase